MRYVRWALLVVAAIGLVGSFGYIVYTPPPPVPAAFATLVADMIVPPVERNEEYMSAVNLDGSVLEFKDLAGDIVIVDFWATWCGPCITEIPHYNSLAHDYADKGVHLIGLTVESGSSEEILEWMASDEKLQMHYPLVQVNDELMNTFGPVFGFPTTLLLDRDGNVVKRWIGAAPNKSAQIRELLDKMLAGEPLE